MNQNIHKKVNCKITQNASIIFFTEKTRNFKVIPQDKAVKKKKKSARFGGLKEPLETFIFYVACITVNAYMNRPLAPVGFNCQL